MLRSVLFVLISWGLLGDVMAFEASPARKCMVGVVDVGSTGSRLHVYAYDCDHKIEGANEVWFNKITPGYASLESKQSVIDAYLKNLFDGAPEHIPVYLMNNKKLITLPLIIGLTLQRGILLRQKLSLGAKKVCLHGLL